MGEKRAVSYFSFVLVFFVIFCLSFVSATEVSWTKNKISTDSSGNEMTVYYPSASSGIGLGNMEVYDGKLYYAYNYDNTKAGGIYELTGQNWKQVIDLKKADFSSYPKAPWGNYGYTTIGSGRINDLIRAITFYKDKLYVATGIGMINEYDPKDNFKFVRTIDYIVYPPSDKSGDLTPFDLVALNDKLYVSTVLGGVYEIDLSTLESKGISSPVMSDLIVYNNNLYAKGWYGSSGGRDSLQKLEGSTFNNIQSSPGEVSTGQRLINKGMAVHDGNLYFSLRDYSWNDGGGDSLYKYDGTTVTKLSSYTGQAFHYVNSITSHNNKLFLGVSSSLMAIDRASFGASYFETYLTYTSVFSNDLTSTSLFFDRSGASEYYMMTRASYNGKIYMTNNAGQIFEYGPSSPNQAPTPTNVPVLTCNPVNSEVLVNTNIALTASGGDGTYAWESTSADGTLSATTGSSVQVKFSSQGNSKTVTVQSGSQKATCTIKVTSSITPTPSTSPTIKKAEWKDVNGATIGINERVSTADEISLFGETEGYSEGTEIKVRVYKFGRDSPIKELDSLYVSANSVQSQGQTLGTVLSGSSGLLVINGEKVYFELYNQDPEDITQEVKKISDEIEVEISEERNIMINALGCSAFTTEPECIANKNSYASDPNSAGCGTTYNCECIWGVPSSSETVKRCYLSKVLKPSPSITSEALEYSCSFVNTPIVKDDIVCYNNLKKMESIGKVMKNGVEVLDPTNELRNSLGCPAKKVYEVPCGLSITALPFFGIWQAIIVVVLIVAGYLIFFKLKSKKPSRKKSKN